MASESNRQTQLKIELGGEQVEIERIRATEALSEPFHIALDLIAEHEEIDLLPHLGKLATITLREDDAHRRYFTGLPVDGAFIKETTEGFHYRLTLVPWTWFMTQNSQFAIFQDMSAVDIIKKVFTDAGASDVEYRLNGSYKPRVYCVQYRESDFAFVSRLMEEEGIYYFYRHEATRHVLVLCDAPSSHKAGDPAELHYNPDSVSVFNIDSAARAATDTMFYLQRWTERVSSLSAAKVTIRDFDFEKPEKPLEARTEAARAHPRDTQEIYHYPGRYPDEGVGGSFSQVMLDARRAARKLYVGNAQSQALACGGKVRVDGHDTERLNGEFLIVRTLHSITAEKYRSGEADEEDDFNIEFQAVPAAVQWRAPASTPRPVISGLETAIVTGPPGEEIYCDKYGRVKVRFPWDRSGSQSEKSTCWMRVSQTGGLGNIILPRVGHEVLVDFLDGNPDRPLVVGRVFNAQNMPTYALPENKTRALWRTKRYGETGDYGHAKALDTGQPGVNELRFEDKGGHEEVFIHAERDMNTRIRHKETHHVGHDQGIMIGYNRDEDVGNDETVKIGKNQTNDIGENQKETIGANRDVTVKSDDNLDVKGKITIKAGSTIEIEAGASITLKVGSTTIKLDPMSIKLDGTMINVTGKAMAELTSPMTTVKGDGMLTAKGGIVMIN